MPAVSGLSKYAWGDPAEAALHPQPVVGRRPSDHMPVLNHGRPAPDMVGDQADDLPTASHFQARMFRMWLPEEHEAYRLVLDHVVNGQFHLVDRVKILAPEDETGLPGQHMKIWLEWGQVYVQASDPREALGPGGYR